MLPSDRTKISDVNCFLFWLTISSEFCRLSGQMFIFLYFFGRFFFLNFQKGKYKSSFPVFFFYKSQNFLLENKIYKAENFC